MIDGRDEADARRQAEARGLFVSAIRPLRATPFSAAGRQRAHALPLLLFSQELLALLQAGLGIVEALEALLEKEASPATRSVLTRLLEGLREGKRFSAVLAEQAELFPPLYVGIVKAAEGTSDLPRALSRYIDYQQRIDAVRAKIVSAAIYPAILLAVGGGVSAFLISYVVPRFAEVYQGAGRTLPWMSQVMLSWGKFVTEHGLLLLLGLALASSVLFMGVRRVLRHGGVARLLAEGGITIVQAISTVQAMVSPGMQVSLQQARAAIEAGQPLSSAFEQYQLTTPISLRMLRVGERTGDMGPMLTQSAAFTTAKSAAGSTVSRAPSNPC